MFVIAVVAISLAVLGTVSCVLNYQSTIDTIEQMMKETAEVAASRVEQELLSYRNIAAETGMVARLSNAELSNEDKQEIVDTRVKNYDLSYAKVVQANGKSLDGIDYSGEAFVEASLKGETYISEPNISEGGNLDVYISAPLWEAGIPDTKVVGVVVVVPKKNFMGEIVNSIQVSENGGAYIVDGQGYTIAHKDEENVQAHENTQEDAKSDSSLEALATLEKEMTDGNAGSGKYAYAGSQKFLAYAPIAETNRWSIGINAPLGILRGSLV